MVSDSYNIFLGHESKNIYKKRKVILQNFTWFQYFAYKLCVIMCICIAP